MKQMSDYTRMKITDDNGNELDHVPVANLLDQEIIVVKAMHYTSQKGPGVTIVFQYEEDGPMFYTATHSVGLVNVLKREDVMKILEDEPIAAKIVKDESTQTKGRFVYKFA